MTASSGAVATAGAGGSASIGPGYTAGAAGGNRPLHPGPRQRLVAIATLNSSALFGRWPSQAAFFVLDPPLIPDETDKPRHTGLEARLADIVDPTLTHLGFELVRVAVLGRERPTVQIMVDRADGAPLRLEDCESLTHILGAVIDVQDPMPGQWTMEISSAGIDRPLTRRRDWVRWAGHAARAELAVPLEGRKRFAGTVLGADMTHARLRLDDGAEVALPLADLKSARLVLTDALIAAATPPATPN